MENCPPVTIDCGVQVMQPVCIDTIIAHREFEFSRLVRSVKEGRQVIETATKRAIRPVKTPVGEELKQIVRWAIRARKSVLLEGESGIGKSEILAELGTEVGGHITLDLSLLEPTDLIGLPQIVEGRTKYAAPACLPKNGKGLLVLEELNRCERFVQQCALELLTKRRLHEYVLPDDWVVCACINPEDGQYHVTPLDPALRKRFLVLKVHADRDAWLRWAQENGLHRIVRSIAKRHDRIFDDVPPRSWK